ncbi:MAG: (d)CMP kinase [Deltaproteobacteria bacterium]|nr:MAG: (d)CMP kinase [Deltaproteobacteria bacterium]
MIIAMDGPAGAGKSTAARAVARSLGFRLVNTGALYRAVAWQALERGVALDDEDGLAELAKSLPLAFEGEVLLLEGRPLGAQLRTALVSDATSRISALQAVRDALLGLQRELASQGDAVLEGRDIGTVVCPDASLKLFVTASLDERAMRRWREYPEGELTLEEVREELRRRDERDAGREIAPALPADDAIHLDTTGLTIDEVVARVEALVAERRAISRKAVDDSGGCQ